MKTSMILLFLGVLSAMLLSCTSDTGAPAVGGLEGPELEEIEEDGGEDLVGEATFAEVKTTAGNCQNWYDGSAVTKAKDNWKLRCGIVVERMNPDGTNTPAKVVLGPGETRNIDVSAKVVVDPRKGKQPKPGKKDTNKFFYGFLGSQLQIGSNNPTTGEWTEADSVSAGADDFIVNGQWLIPVILGPYAPGVTYEIKGIEAAGKVCRNKDGAEESLSSKGKCKKKFKPVWTGTEKVLGRFVVQQKLLPVAFPSGMLTLEKLDDNDPDDGNDIFFEDAGTMVSFTTPSGAGVPQSNDDGTIVLELTAGTESNIDVAVVPDAGDLVYKGGVPVGPVKIDAARLVRVKVGDDNGDGVDDDDKIVHVQTIDLLGGTSSEFDGWLTDGKIRFKWFLPDTDENGDLILDENGNSVVRAGNTVIYETDEDGNNNYYAVLVQVCTPPDASAGTTADCRWIRQDFAVEGSTAIQELLCGDGLCDGGEDETSCPGDCPASGGGIPGVPREYTGDASALVRDLNVGRGMYIEADGSDKCRPTIVTHVAPDGNPKYISLLNPEDVNLGHPTPMFYVCRLEDTAIPPRWGQHCTGVDVPGTSTTMPTEKIVEVDGVPAVYWVGCGGLPQVGDTPSLTVG